MNELSPVQTVDDSALLAQLQRLAPFIRRAGVTVTGREKIARMGSRKIAFVWCARELSDNSRRQILTECAAMPVYQALTSEDFKSLYGLENTRVFALKRCTLTEQTEAALQPYRIRLEMPTQQK